MDTNNDSPYQDKLDSYSSHMLIRNWIQRFAPGTRILDIGTATGTLGRLCQGSGYVINGLEPNSKWAELARPYYNKVLSCKVEEAPDDFLKNYQVVVLADVLEHMPEPEKSLERLVSLQSPGTVFIISVPNITNLSVRLSLLFGRFNYTDHGILDRTHLRFFTKTTLVRFVEGAGLSPCRIQSTTIPLSLVSSFFTKNAAGRLAYRTLAGSTRLLPNLLGYQFVAELEKP